MSEQSRPEATPVSALRGHLHPGEHGVSRDGGPGVTLAERRPAAICQVNGAPDEKKLAQALGSLGLKGTPSPRRAWNGADACLLWNGPGMWLAVSWKTPAKEWLAALRKGLDGSDATVTDLSGSRTVLNVSGPCVAELLLKGCPLDVESMTEGDSATSLHGRLTVHVHARGEAGFDLYVYRSFGLALWEQLEDGALEFGLRVAAGDA